MKRTTARGPLLPLATTKLELNAQLRRMLGQDSAGVDDSGQDVQPGTICDGVAHARPAASATPTKLELNAQLRRKLGQRRLASTVPVRTFSLGRFSGVACARASRGFYGRGVECPIAPLAGSGDASRRWFRSERSAWDGLRWAHARPKLFRGFYGRGVECPIAPLVGSGDASRRWFRSERSAWDDLRGVAQHGPQSVAEPGIILDNHTELARTDFSKGGTLKTRLSDTEKTQDWNDAQREGWDVSAWSVVSPLRRASRSCAITVIMTCKPGLTFRY